MKNLTIKNAKKLKTILGMGAIALVMSFTGCEETVVEDATEIYDVIDSQGEEIEIKTQVLDVPGEDFQLVVEYSLDPNAQKHWRITDNKKLYTKVYTKGLKEGVKVWIDNVHTDTTLVATKSAMNGILQDSMDDRIHNSLMYGFPIDNDTALYAANEIDGQNDTFIAGSVYGFNGTTSGTVVEQRFLDEDYLEKGVYANKISSVYGLLIQKGEEELYGVDVSSDIIVTAYNKVQKKDDSGNIKVYQYHRDGSYSIIESDEKQKAK